MARLLPMLGQPRILTVQIGRMLVFNPCRNFGVQLGPDVAFRLARGNGRAWYSVDVRYISIIRCNNRCGCRVSQFMEYLLGV